MSKAIRAWTIGLQDYPGWKEWKRQIIGHTLHFDDPFPLPSPEPAAEFKFSDDIEKQHAIALQYLELQATISSLKEWIVSREVV